MSISISDPAVLASISTSAVAFAALRSVTASATSEGADASTTQTAVELEESIDFTLVRDVNTSIADLTFALEQSACPNQNVSKCLVWQARRSLLAADGMVHRRLNVAVRFNVLRTTFDAVAAMPPVIAAIAQLVVASIPTASVSSVEPKRMTTRVVVTQTVSASQASPLFQGAGSMASILSAVSSDVGISAALMQASVLSVLPPSPPPSPNRPTEYHPPSLPPPQPSRPPQPPSRPQSPAPPQAWSLSPAQIVSVVTIAALSLAGVLCIAALIRCFFCCFRRPAPVGIHARKPVHIDFDGVSAGTAAGKPVRIDFEGVSAGTATGKPVRMDFEGAQLDASEGSKSDGGDLSLELNEELARAFVAAGVVAQASSSQGNGGEGVGTLTDAVADSTTIEPVRFGVLAAAMAAEDIASDEASSSSWRPVSGHGGASEPSPVRLTAGRNSGLVVPGTSQNPNLNEKSRLFDDQAAGRQPPSAVSQLRDNLPPAAHGLSPFKQLRREAGGS